MTDTNYYSKRTSVFFLFFERSVDIFTSKVYTRYVRLPASLLEWKKNVFISKLHSNKLCINIHFLAALTLYATTVDLNPNKQINLCLKGRFFSFNSEVLQKWMHEVFGYYSHFLYTVSIFRQLTEEQFRGQVRRALLSFHAKWSTHLKLIQSDCLLIFSVILTTSPKETSLQTVWARLAGCS